MNMVSRQVKYTNGGKFFPILPGALFLAHAPVPSWKLLEPNEGHWMKFVRKHAQIEVFSWLGG